MNFNFYTDLQTLLLASHQYNHGRVEKMNQFPNNCLWGRQIWHKLLNAQWNSRFSVKVQVVDYQCSGRFCLSEDGHNRVHNRSDGWILRDENNRISFFSRSQAGFREYIIRILWNQPSLKCNLNIWIFFRCRKFWSILKGNQISTTYLAHFRLLAEQKINT